MVHRVAKFCFYLIVSIMVVAEKTCPESNSDEPELIPNPRDCTKFYICDNGAAYRQNCSGGLYFNPTLEVCDRPENVVFCEYDDFLYIKPHCNCSNYIICNFGVVEVRECAQGYHFSDRSVKLSNYFNPCDLGEC